MLRRKLLARLGPLVLAFLAATLLGVLMLQSVLRDLDHLTTETAALADSAAELGLVVAQVRAERAGGARPGTAVADALGRVPVLIARIDGAVASDPRSGCAGAAGRVRSALPDFQRWATGVDGGSPDAAVRLSSSIGALSESARAHIQAERAHVRARLRLVVAGIIIAALVLLNAAVLVLLHTARLVLRPVDELIEASRQLGLERFDYRVDVRQRDEFDQLAGAYNALAAQLARNEERKMETLHQVATALNHDLNNVLSIVSLQLTRMDRESDASPALRERLRSIQQSLSRMAETIQSLGRVRRIVLTEYLPGRQMLDLPRSLEPAPDGSAAP
jgi:HAMP domain-containing protein